MTNSNEFQQWFESHDFYTNMRVIHGDRLFTKDGDVYRILTVQIAYKAWRYKEKSISKLKDSLTTYKIETYESHGRLDFLHHHFSRVSHEQFIRDLYPILRGKLRHPEFSFNRERIKHLRGDQ